jgi:hypothetical protein
MAERFATTLDCADITFITDHTLDELPQPPRTGLTRTGGIDLNKPRIRAALSAALALAAAPHGFTVAEFTAKVSSMTGQARYTIRQGAYDLRNTSVSPPARGTERDAAAIGSPPIASLVMSTERPGGYRSAGADRPYPRPRHDVMNVRRDGPGQTATAAKNPAPRTRYQRLVTPNGYRPG